MIQKPFNWWQGLARRERTLVAVAAGIVALGLIFLLAIEPAWKARKRLGVDLPRLQGELVQIEALHDEIRELKDRTGGVQTSDALHAAAEQSIKRANIAGEVAKQGDSAISITARNVSVTKWFKWLETFMREARVQVVASRVERVSTGRVDASVSFSTAAAVRR
jgi:general secretion pathway protein M